MTKIIRENKKWRIVLDTAEGSEVLTNDFYVGRCGSATRCRLRLGPAVAKLEIKQRFFWKTFWSRREFTNITNVVQEWIAEYFSDGNGDDCQTKSS